MGRSERTVRISNQQGLIKGLYIAIFSLNSDYVFKRQMEFEASSSNTVIRSYP